MTMTTETQQAPEPRGIEDRLAALEQQVSALALRLNQMATWQASAQRRHAPWRLA